MDILIGFAVAALKEGILRAVISVSRLTEQEATLDS